MKILYDHQIFGTQKYGGISRYFFELIKHLDGLDGINYELSLEYAANFYVLNDPRFDLKKDTRTDSFFFGLQFRGRARLFDMLGRLSIVDNPQIKNLNHTVGLLKDSKFDVFHPTAYGDYYLPHLKKPFVLTVYDMIHEVYVDKPFERSYRQLIQRKSDLIRRASRIIAISENTKRDIVRMCNVDEGKITVVYLANSLDPEAAGKTDLSIPGNYILFVGDRHAYKNFEFFAESIAPLLSEDNGLFLVCAGSKNFTPEESSLFDRHKLVRQVIHVPFSDDGVLINLYRKAACFVYPTLYEGFGIPILEAFACGCPVVVSNTSSLPEVAGDAGIYFDPTDAGSILEAVRRAVYDPEIRRAVVNKGTQQLKKFSWDKCARETADVYRSVM